MPSDVPAAVEVCAAVYQLQTEPEFTANDVRERVDAKRRTVYNRLADLKEVGVIEEVRTDGKTQVLRAVPPSGKTEQED